MLSEGILQVAITVSDVEAATAYYRDTLGMKHLFSTNGMSFLQSGPTRVLLGSENPTGQKVLLYFRVADVREAAKRLAKNGVKLEEEPRLIAKLEDRDVWLAAFRDPDGSYHHIMSETARSVTPSR